jgi:hypothetical protein
MNEKNNKIIDVSKNEQIVPKNEAPILKRPIYIRSLNLFARPFRDRYEKHYREKKYHIFVDTLFVVVIILLCILNFILVFRKNDFSFSNIAQNYFRVNQAKLEMNLSVNGKTELVASAGEKLNYILTIKNNSAEAIKDMAVKVKLEGVGVDERTIISQGKFENGGLIWTASENEALKNFKQGEEISFDFSFMVKKELSISNPSILTKASVTGFIGDKSFSEDSSENRVKILSDFSVVSSYAYYTEEGEQLGVGAWPPKIGEETKIRIFFDIKNSINKINNAKLAAKLAPGISWTGKFAVNFGAPIEYNLDKNEISWDIGNVLTSENPSANFEIQFTPTSNEILKNMELVYDIKISGYDSFANFDIVKNGEKLILSTIK